VPQSSDEFNTTALSPQWEWNYQPRPEKWSLDERPGWLRLHAFKPSGANDLLKAGNTLTQRCFRTATNEVVAAFELGGMADGQEAGLCHFAKTHSALGVAQEGASRVLINLNDGEATSGPKITGNRIWLKSVWGLDGRSRYAYSLDGRTFTEFGRPYQLSWGNYRGDRIGIYNYNRKAEQGYVDVDFFHYDFSGPHVGHTK
jgi:beta-xylosidase